MNKYFSIGDKIILKDREEFLKDGFVEYNEGFRFYRSKHEYTSIYINNTMISDFSKKTFFVSKRYEKSFGYDIIITPIKITESDPLPSMWSWSSFFFKSIVPKQLELFNEI